ncbi:MULTISPECIES: AMP-binding protein [Kordiimonas]|uniref:AMP-binding protein n=1 Tax=Kordiimonas TaxID=288021 RepID=UPI00257B332E|nr:AMP-binding protein [Kordiimonas sp. UBA4487]
MIRDYLNASINQYSERIAVEDSSKDWALTYAELRARANDLFFSLEPQSDWVLILYVDKSIQYYACMAACFLFEVDFCPVDPQTPVAKLLEISLQFENATILTDTSERFEHIAPLYPKVIQFPEKKDDIHTRSKKPSNQRRQAPRYFIATSGSTGKPKIVSVPHDNTSDFVKWAVSFYKVDSHTRWSQFSSIGFDLSIVDFLTVLCGGGTLISIASNIDRLRPGKTIQKACITHWHSVPSIIPYVLSETAETTNCTLFSFCGEPLASANVEELAKKFPRARIVNTYGPTEGTLFCSFYEYEGPHAVSTDTIPIGKAIPGWNFILVPEQEGLRLVLVSKNISSGYVGITSDKFKEIDFSGTILRSFDTGDFFRLEDGELVFSHRQDGMVKVSGNRIDLGEIEAACQRNGLQNPIAFIDQGRIIVCSEGVEQPDDRVLREKLGTILPTYAIPSTFILQPSHPRTTNGKIDRLIVAQSNLREGSK